MVDRNKCIVYTNTMQNGSATQAESTSQEAEQTLRMRDLVRESGLSRATIHFYQQQGLLPQPREKIRNSATYGPEHLERLRRIRQLRDKQFLPLRAIKAVFDGVPEQEFTPEQVRLLHSVRDALPRGSTDEKAGSEMLEAVDRGVPENELRALRDAGLIGAEEDPAELTADDAEILVAWSELKQIGIGPERGFEPTDLGLFDRAMARLVAEEFALFLPRFADASGSEAAGVVQQALPILERLIGATHRKKVRAYLEETP